MKTFVLVVAGCLVCAGSSSAGILKMSCKKPICPCTCYGPCAGYFPTQWRAWPCPTPTVAAETVAPAPTEPAPVTPAPTPPPTAPIKKTAADMMLPSTAELVPTQQAPAYIHEAWHVAP
ncbi:MAG TPA: hypothetical protein VFA18_13205 [Gemmataceae bacterium]|nr:hypothetical protein [Gemmataceae bacterium]